MTDSTEKRDEKATPRAFTFNMTGRLSPDRGGLTLPQILFTGKTGIEGTPFVADDYHFDYAPEPETGECGGGPLVGMTVRIEFVSWSFLPDDEDTAIYLRPKKASRRRA